jgi:ABC-type uncharacterized transport system auxiliary subunit
MPGKKFLLGLIVITAFMWDGCRSSKPVIPRYYIIEYPQEADAEFNKKYSTFGASVEVLPVEIFPAFAGHRIALREETHGIRYFSNHEWAVRPEESMKLFLVKFLEQNKVFEKISTRYWIERPDYQLLTRIYQLEIAQKKNSFYAHLNLNFQLIHTQTGRVVSSHLADLSTPLDRRNINLFADEISLLFFNELHLFFEKTHALLSQI